MHELQISLASAFKLSENETLQKCTDIVDRIWSIGPKKCGTNVLLNMTDYRHQSFWKQEKRTAGGTDDVDVRNDVVTSFLNGFQLTSLAGPLCEEPMHGVCFVVEEWTIDGSTEGNQTYGPFSGKNIFFVKNMKELRFLFSYKGVCFKRLFLSVLTHGPFPSIHHFHSSLSL